MTRFASTPSVATSELASLGRTPFGGTLFCALALVAGGCADRVMTDDGGGAEDIGETLSQITGGTQGDGMDSERPDPSGGAETGSEGGTTLTPDPDPGDGGSEDTSAGGSETGSDTGSTSGPGDTGESTDEGGESESTGGPKLDLGGPQVCAPENGDDECDSCLKEGCCDELEVCVEDLECECMLDCLDEGGSFPVCAFGCGFIPGQEPELVEVLACGLAECEASC